jgi:hypothetical protein
MDVRTTMAMTNILWIQQEYHPHSEIYDRVVEIATKWNAAVELMRLAPSEEAPNAEAKAVAGGDARQSKEEPLQSGTKSQEYNGGIEEDLPDDETDDGGLTATLDELAGIGKSGGGRTVFGDQHKLMDSLDRRIPYTLVVIGNLFKSKGHAARLRATRDLRSFLSDRIKAPVVTNDELESKYLFGKKDIIKALAFIVLTFAIYLLVFGHQNLILEFMSNSGWYARAIEGTFLARFSWLPKIVTSAAVLILVPVVAYLYGSVSGAILKLIKME